MKRFKVTYNGITSVFNAFEKGRFSTTYGNEVVSYGCHYGVRPSKENKMEISDFYVKHENGNTTYHFITRSVFKQPRGLKVYAEEISVR